MKLRYAYIVCFVFFILLCFLLPTQRGYDTHFWVAWANAMGNTGLANAYALEGLNYNPAYLYVLSVYQAIVGSPEAVAHNIHYLKIFTLLFDFGAVLLLMRWINKNGGNYLLAFFILFNVAYLYNTLFWGQVDAIHTAFIFASCVAAFNKKPVWSLVLFVLALNTKTQSILFLPVLGLLWLPLIKNNAKAISKGLAAAALVQIIILLPFIIKGTVGDVWHNLTGVVDYNALLSLHADNYWYLALWDNHEEPRILSDLNTWMGVTFKTWGFIMFTVASAIALLPLLLKSIIALIKDAPLGFEDSAQFMLSAALVTLIFFFFPTQMHERYSHPALIFAGTYFVLSKRWLMFALICYAYVMNLESWQKGWQLDNYRTFIFDARLIAIVYALAIALGVYRLYKDYGFKADWVFLKNSFNKKALA